MLHYFQYIDITRGTRNLVMTSCYSLVMCQDRNSEVGFLFFLPIKWPFSIWDMINQWIWGYSIRQSQVASTDEARLLWAGHFFRSVAK
jgi:hypothetical protein